MSRYIIRRSLFLALTVLLTSMIIFIITQYLPGDVARVIMGREAGEAQLQALRDELGLNDPLPVQYARWLGNFLTGDWGTSFSTKETVVGDTPARSATSRIVTRLRAIDALTFGLLVR